MGSAVLAIAAEVGAGPSGDVRLEAVEGVVPVRGGGRLTIDDNVSERRLRDQAIGRKNWMFLGSARAGRRAAVLRTIIAGAKRHRLEPWAYVRDVVL